MLRQILDGDFARSSELDHSSCIAAVKDGVEFRGPDVLSGVILEKRGEGRAGSVTGWWFFALVGSPDPFSQCRIVGEGRGREVDCFAVLGCNLLPRVASFKGGWRVDCDVVVRSYSSVAK